MNRRNFIKGGIILATGIYLNPIIAFANDKLKWWQKTVVYQIYPKSFSDTTGKGTGDLNGITNHLDYLKSLGIGAIWLTPVYPSPMIDNGYDISNYTEIDSAYGTMKDFENLIFESDKRGIKIVMDLVFNHSSDKHAWFLESKKNKTNSKSDWYIWRNAKSDGSAPTNWRSIFGGSAWEWCEERKQYYLHTFAVAQPDLNWENPEVRQALYDSANFWLEKGVGGFRIDAITYIKKPKNFFDGEVDGKDGMSAIHNMTANTEGILDFLREFKEKVFVGHDIFTVGEANGVAASELKDWVGERGVFDMLFEFSHVNLPLKNGEIWCRPTDWRLTDLKKAISNSQAATKSNGWYPVFFENHDKPRCVNYFFKKGADKVKAAKVIATVLLTMRGTPFVFEGQELGMSNISWNEIEMYNDIGSRSQFDFAIEEGFSKDKAMEFVKFFSRDNARTPMQWSDKKNAGFSVAEKTWLPVNENYSEVNADAEEKNSDSVLNWYRKLARFRTEHEEILHGNFEMLLPEDEKIFAFSRGNKFITAVNFSLETAELPKTFINKKILIDSEEKPEKSVLKPLEARIYKN